MAVMNFDLGIRHDPNDSRHWTLSLYQTPTTEWRRTCYYCCQHLSTDKQTWHNYVNTGTNKTN